jgi:hypothetical protein
VAEGACAPREAGIAITHQEGVPARQRLAAVATHVAHRLTSVRYQENPNCRGFFLMRAFLLYALTTLCILPTRAFAAQPVELSKQNYKAEIGVIILQVNWGRTWKCGAFENAQIQALTFTKTQSDGNEPVSLELETPSKLFVNNKFLPYALVVQPGEYVLTAFDVKVARSTKDVAHIKGTKASLFKEGKAVGGSFNVGSGEIVYLGHFGLDCAAEPFLWRYYIDGREEFEKYVEGFRMQFPFAKSAPVHFRLLATEMFGNPFSLQEPTVK